MTAVAAAERASGLAFVLLATRQSGCLLIGPHVAIRVLLTYVLLSMPDVSVIGPQKDNRKQR